MKKRFIYSTFMILTAGIVMALGLNGLPQWQKTAVLKADTSAPQQLSSTDGWDGPVIYGTMYYNVDENSATYGIYAVDAASGRMAPMLLDPRVNANGGGVYDNGLYKFVCYDNELDAAVYYEYRVSDWSRVRSEVLPDKSNLAFDEAYDPSTGNIYGCFSDAKAMNFVFGIIDHDTHQVTVINQPDMPYFAVVATPDGKVYAIASDGNLYKIDKTTGARALVGPTGVSPKYSQTAVCDLQTGKVYWLACNTAGATGIYEVDLTTGKATMKKSFTKGEGFTGAIIAQTPYRSDAPDAVAGWSAEFDGASLSGKVSFTMPDKTVGGDALSGNIDYSVMVGTRKCASGSAAPGQRVSHDLNLEEGVAKFSVTVSGQTGYGKPFKATEYIGYDAPEAISDLMVNLKDDNTAVLSWKAPAAGFNGGYFDTSAISYKIVRNPGNTIISSGYKKLGIEHKLPKTEYGVYRFDITPKSHGHEGPLTSSNYVAVGPAATLPASFPADSRTLALNAGTSGGWTYDADVEAYMLNGGNCTGGDMLITPYVNLDKAYSYRVTLSASLAEDASPAVVGIKAGEKPEASSFTVGGMTPLEINSAMIADYDSYIYLPASGVYHIGVVPENVTPASAFGIYYVKISRGPACGAPAMPRNLTVNGAADGQHKADITFSAPSTSIDGKSITSLNEVVIYREGVRIGSVSAQPGSTQTFTDTEVPGNGVTHYSVAAVNAQGEGVPATASAYVGEDVPLAPQNIHISETAEGIELTWDVPAQGVNGAHLSADALRYAIVRSDNAIVARDINGTRFVDNFDFGFPQKYVQYAICAVSAAGQGAFGYSDAFVVGKPYDCPFEEEFTRGGLDYPFWAQEANGAGQFTLNGGNGHDGDSGYAGFSPKSQGAVAALISGKISMDGAVNPALGYCFDARCGSGLSLEVSVRTPDGLSKVVDQVDFAALTGPSGWRKRVADLSEFARYAYVRIAFSFTSRDGETKSGIDMVTVNESFAHDAEASMTAPTAMNYNETAVATVDVLNRGHEPLAAGAYTVALYKDNKKVASATGRKAEPFETVGYDMEFSSDIFDDEFGLYAVVEYSADEDTQNNTTAETSVRVKQSTLPAPAALTGSVDADDVVSLNWQEPDRGKFTSVVVEDDVESYDAFAISGVGDWTMIDVDGARTFGIGDGNGSYHAFPNAIDPKAFIVFNAPESGVEVYTPVGIPTKWAPHSGDQMFVSFQASHAISDDWMISPRLSGKAQTISFWTRSVDVAGHGAESYEVLWSDGGTTINDFIVVEGGQCQAPAEWTKVSYELPEGALYFAIRATSVSGFALMIDDLTFSTADYGDLEVEGYNVYCNRVLLTEQPLKKCEFSDKIFRDDSHYAVSAVYASGESRPTESVRLVSSGVDNALSASVIVKAVGHCIIVENAAGSALEIFTPDGTLRRAVSNIAQRQSVDVPSGLYIVRVGGITAKVIVK